MQIEFIILLILMAAGFAGVFWFLHRSRQVNPADQQHEQSMMMLLQGQMNEVTRTLDMRLSESTQMLQSQYGTTARLTGEITEKLAKLEETNRQVVGFADQLQNLQDILKNPKQRGILGEYYLETLLKNVMPPGSFQMQYAFPDGLIADAVVFVKEKKICIDSKFSLENYNRILEAREPAEKERLEKIFRQDLKNRIDETSKYVKPEDGTMEFAFMFIPAEAIYYDLLINQVGAVKVNTQDLIQYAFKDRRVIIVSPTSFLAYLQTVLQGLRALQIEESAKEIRKRVEELGRHLGAYDTFMQKLGTHLGTSVNMYNSAYKEFAKIDKDVLRITGEKAGIEPMALTAPEDIG
ncbi:MAG: DNA recombination protein RmuC [Candidatus Sungbacteria bacterium]|nr:DNA recombination protein RmuC [Candidatus Sungbacteria bacterium]